MWALKAEGATHSPPDNIIWKGVDMWGAGDKTITKLISHAGEVRPHPSSDSLLL